MQNLSGVLLGSNRIEILEGEFVRLEQWLCQQFTLVVVIGQQLKQISRLLVGETASKLFLAGILTYGELRL